MKQLLQIYRTGELRLDDVPAPALHEGMVLVRNAFSLISAGTEKSKIDLANKSLAGKAMARPDLVKKVLGKLKKEGFAATMRTVQARLDEPAPLGYSSAGEVVAVCPTVSDIRPGDLVACGGAGYANHAEVIAVPRNLVVKVPANVGLLDASMTTVGAIALQGIRLARPELGESFLVIGLGLIGQIAARLLRANGCEAIGFDQDERMSALARAAGVRTVGANEDPIAYCLQSNGGRGVDGVLICAGTASNAPIELAGTVTRERGRVVVIGAVGMQVPREPYYEKEIELVISKSYGPGRYDPAYEEGGLDYPFGHVRFTENRNMQAFLDAVSRGHMQVADIVTHQFDFGDAVKAYEMIRGDRREPYLGIALRYGKASSVKPDIGSVAAAPLASGQIRLSVIGAGNYATATLLPAIKKLPEVRFNAVATSSGSSARAVAQAFGFQSHTDNIDALLGPQTDAVLIATRHDSHASLVARALRAGKHVAVEKPLAIEEAGIRLVMQAVRDAPDRMLLVGFNRSFAPLTLELKAFFPASAPKVVNVRVNAGPLAVNHWLNDAKVGGGRLIGEGCHFFDLCTEICGENPTSVFARSIPAPGTSSITGQDILVTLSYSNGSIATITYAGSGSTGLAKERIEVFGVGRAAVLDDFVSLELYDENRNKKTSKGKGQDKGQSTMLSAFFQALKSGRRLQALERLVLTTIATIRAVESIAADEPMSIALPALDAVAT